ncbi:MAG: NAD(P)-binding protein [Candidatus Eisenbacteria bacterium]|nr:NAD(P)-binding protein [Candidatus Eisenbacteria bacterium]
MPKEERREPVLMPEHPVWSEAEALIEARRCLYCFDAPCTRGCPAELDVAEFIRSIASGAFRSAARLVLEANPLGETCGCVCPTEVLCEGECVLSRMDGQRPIAVGRLQRFAVHWARNRNVPLFQLSPPTGKRIALIGAGPASLACAHELARFGHTPVLFERDPLPGGLNRTAISPLKMDSALPLAEADWLLRTGIELRCGVTVGRDITFADLERDHDAVFIGAGQGPDERLGVRGEDAEGVLGAIDFLNRIKSGNLSPPLPWQRVLCVGGGNSAVDAARTLRDLGVPEVMLVYRRGEEQMRVYPADWRAAKIAGVTASFLTLPIEVRVRNGRAWGLRCVRMRLDDPDESGRPRPVAVPDSEHDIAADAIVVAIGQSGPRDLLPGLPPQIGFQGSRIEVCQDTGATSRPGYYAGGDCVSGGAEVVNAAAEGRRAARAIDRYLKERGTESWQTSR